MTTDLRTSSIAYVFPGQGSQYPGMGKDLAERFEAARLVFEEADEALGFKLSSLCFAGPAEDLQLTENTQPAILAVSVAAWRVLREANFPVASFVAGHSLGEYSALVAAGAISLADALRTVRARGRYMQEAVPVGTGAMAAIIGGDVTEIERICGEAAEDEICSLANLNSPNQVVIAGNAAAVDRAAERLKDVAKRVVKLNVSAPFHCALMKPAQEQLAVNLNQIQFEKAQVPVVTNADAEVTSEAAALRDALYKQVSAPVRWTQSMELLISKGIGTFVEVGPGKVLTGLMRQISREVTCLNVEDTTSLEATKAKLEAQM
ncbi:MAG TPA: ACP S-malonyltransferase [Pyrinomonadaceae bacterium]|nr:ACP S-malonyltransferase [Pyrinomonadaceae bacterium]